MKLKLKTCNTVLISLIMMITMMTTGKVLHSLRFLHSMGGLYCR